MTDPLEPIRALARRVEEVLAPLGVTVELFSIQPSTDGSPDHAQLVVTIDVEEASKGDEQRELDRQFQALTHGLEGDIARQSVDDKEAAAIESLRRMAARNGGDFLADDPEDPEVT